jgi:hypothetical protein
MAFASIERYFLIFHERFVYKWRFIIHYSPIIICCIYPLMFYNLIVNLYPCENVYDYESYVCGGACFQFQALPSTADYTMDVVSPTVLIVLANIILLLRVRYRKQAMKIANTWGKHRLMYIQLLSISTLYFVIWIPFVIISLIRLFYDPLFLQDVTMLVINYCLYICPLASPFLALVGLPTVRRRLTRIAWFQSRICRRNQNRIGPAAIGITRPRQQHIIPRQLYDEHAF